MAAGTTVWCRRTAGTPWYGSILAPFLVADLSDGKRCELVFVFTFTVLN